MLMDEINILVVDDRPENLMVMESLLEDLPCKIVKAESGNEALGKLLMHDFALVLLDVQMPEMDGFETAELMRGSERTKRIPIIFVTALSDEQISIFKGYELGAVDYLFKPIDPYIIKSKVKVFIELYKQKKQLESQAMQLEEKLNELIALREANFKLESLTNLDPLTGIANRRSFDQYLGMMWGNSLREKGYISVIMIDIDNFKAYNDNYGHLQGDECLKRVAQVLVSSLKRPLDFVARYGGEEFIAVLPNTDTEGAVALAEVLRYNIELLNIPHEFSKTARSVTISLGVASIVPTAILNIIELIQHADQALYKSKQQGRNQVSHCEL